jgi:hypothetical protein
MTTSERLIELRTKLQEKNPNAPATTADLLVIIETLLRKD